MASRPFWKNPVFWLLPPTLLALVWFLPKKDVLPLSWAFGRGVDRTMLPGLLVAAVFLSVPFGYRFVRGAAPTPLRLLVVGGYGIALVHALAFAEGRGAEPLKETLWKTAHAEFLRIARDQPLDDLIPRYQQLLVERKWTFPRAKPPGMILVFRGMVWLADSQLGDVLGRVWAPSAPQMTRDLRIQGVALTLMPLFTFLTIFPLWVLARLLAGSHEADLAAMLYVVTPSVLIVTNHLDAALYPLIGVGSAALALWGARERRPWAVFLAGALLSLGVFVSFGLLPLVPLIGLLPLGDALIAARSTDSVRRRIVRGIALGGLVAAGLLAVHLSLILGFHYDVVSRFRDALAFQASWWNSPAPWLLGSALQFFLWLGVPTTIAFFVRAIRADWSQTAFLVLATIVLLTLTNALAHARAEAERIWLLFVPFFCAGAATTLARWEDESGPRVVPAVLGLSLLTAFIIKLNYTF
jgi:hypothetical protein